MNAKNVFMRYKQNRAKALVKAHLIACVKKLSS